MPYSGAGDSKLPKNVKEMPEEKREQWVAVFNKAFEACEAGGSGDCEAEAFKAANGAVKRYAGNVAINRAVEAVKSWSGAASGYGDTNAYCAACLIDLNSAAGKTEKSQNYCKLPVKAPGSGSYADKGIMAAAGALAGARGGLKRPSDVSESDWKAALKKAANTIISVYKQMDKQAPDAVYELAGKSVPEKRGVGMSLSAWFEKLFGKSRVVSLDQLYASSYDSIYNEHPNARIHDLYFDGEGTFFIVSEKGRIFRIPVSFPSGGTVEYGEWQPVEINFTPLGQEQSRLRVFRQADGRVRWVAISASSVLNRDGEIDSTALFDDMISRARETGEYPYRGVYHLGEKFRIGQADMLARDGFLYITSGIFDDNDLARAIVADIEANPGKWGDSIGYRSAEHPEMWEVTPGVKIPVFRAGTNVEISSVLAEHACNFFTTAVTMEVNRMNQQVKEILEELMGHERAAAFIQQVDESNERIAQEGLVARSKDATADGGSPGETPPSGQSNSNLPDVDLGDEQNRRAIAKAIADTPEFTERLNAGFSELVKDLVTRVESMGPDVTSLLERAKVLESRLDDLVKRVGVVEQSTEQHQEDVQDLGRRSIRVRAASYRPSQPGQQGEAEDSLAMDGAEQAAGVLANLPKY